MKKVLGMMVFCVLLSIQVQAFEPPHFANTSGELSADALVFTGEGYFYGIMVATDGTNNCTISIYDNTSASGTELIPTWVAVTNSANRAQYFSLPTPVRFGTGIYVDITCAGTAGYTVYYRKK